MFDDALFMAPPNLDHKRGRKKSVRFGNIWIEFKVRNIMCARYCCFESIVKSASERFFESDLQEKKLDERTNKKKRSLDSFLSLSNLFSVAKATIFFPAIWSVNSLRASVGRRRWGVIDIISEMLYALSFFYSSIQISLAARRRKSLPFTLFKLSPEICVPASRPNRCRYD